MQLQACDQFMKYTEKCADRENVCARTVEIITSNVADGEENMFEKEMKEETIDEVCILSCTCEVRNVDEKGGDSEALKKTIRANNYKCKGGRDTYRGRLREVIDEQRRDDGLHRAIAP